MPIIYAVIARQDATVLVDYATSTGNFPQISAHILEKIPPGDSKMTFVYDRYLFHYIASGGVIYMVMADDQFGRRVPFAFLEDVRGRFEEEYDAGRIETGINFEDFADVLAERVNYFNSNPSADRVRQVQNEIDQVKDVMVSNIEKVLERGERIEILVDKTDTLNQRSIEFKKRSVQLRRQQWWKNTRVTVLVFFTAVLLLYFLIAAGCGLDMSRCRHG
ncbi:putative vesicle-associated membrane protein [Hyaloraphidium curvatum]|nr:putative vesicle-associated membrane protein [Hyaloraphidium curvatum]